MDNKQKINCSVCSCEYNETDTNECTLRSIEVSPTPDTETHTPDESMCSSYKYDEDEDEATPSVNNTTWEQE